MRNDLTQTLSTSSKPIGTSFKIIWSPFHLNHFPSCAKSILYFIYEVHNYKKMKATEFKKKSKEERNNDK